VHPCIIDQHMQAGEAQLVEVINKLPAAHKGRQQQTDCGYLLAHAVRRRAQGPCTCTENSGCSGCANKCHSRVPARS
jgi:hypothetical protein